MIAVKPGMVAINRKTEGVLTISTYVGEFTLTSLNGGLDIECKGLGAGPVSAFLDHDQASLVRDFLIEPMYWYN